MEKFGVVQDENTKTSEEKKVLCCPVCHSKLRPVEQTGVLLCPECGSKPFEGGQ